MFPEELAIVGHDLGLEGRFLVFLSRLGALDSFLPAYKKAVSRAIHPDRHSTGGVVKTCEEWLKRFNAAYDTLLSAESDVIGWCTQPLETRETALLSELRRRNRELQQLREDLANARRKNTKRWHISTR